MSFWWHPDLFAQEKRFSVGIEYSANYSIITNPVLEERYKLSHHALIRIGIGVNRITPTIGLGYLNTGELENGVFKPYPIGFGNGVFIPNPIQLVSAKILHNYDYLIIPLGVKIKFKSLYILPEVALGAHLFSKSTSILEYNDGSVKKVKVDEQLINGSFNKATIPVFMSIGKKIPIGPKTSLSVGLKGYYSLNQMVKGVVRDGHYYGLGASLGVQF